MNEKYRQIAREQNSRLIEQVAKLATITQPKQGWIKAVRSALAMSGAALSKRLGGHRTTASYLERSELDGNVTIKKMQQVAEAMHCRFVYAIVPKERYGGSIEKIIEQQGEGIARRIVEQTSVHMMLEEQQLAKLEIEKEIQRLKKEIIEEMPREFWED
jgi:predicted DNA-binding mobile mystery protein A